MRVMFEVVGVPVAQGSKKAFVVGGKARMTEMGKGHNDWRNDVSAAARDTASHLGGPMDGPLKLSAVFRFPMPASRPKAIREQGTAFKTTAPDLSKLVRSIEDSMTAGGLIKDDARIVVAEVTKLEVWEQWTGVTVIVENWEQPRAPYVCMFDRGGKIPSGLGGAT